jgi:hypothetical protein
VPNLIDRSAEHHRQLHLDTRELSLAERYSDDFLPDIRRQEVPAGDKLAQANIRADSMLTGGRRAPISAIFA